MYICGSKASQIFCDCTFITFPHVLLAKGNVVGIYLKLKSNYKNEVETV